VNLPMKQDHDNRWLDPLLEQHIQRKPEKFDFGKWVETHPHEAQLLRSGFKYSSRNTKTKTYEIWRFIMESKVTRYSAIAAIVLATTFVLFGPSWAPGNGSVVLADVQQKVADAETMLIRGTKTFMHPGEDGEIFKFDGIPCVFDLVKYFSKGHGFVEEGYAGGELFYRITFNFQKQQTLLVFPPYKKYLTFPSLDGVAKIMEKFSTPNGVIDLLLEGDYKKLGKDKIDGVEVEGFEFKSIGSVKKILPKPIFDIQDYIGKVWIGIEEQLPVRIEGDLNIGKSFMTMFNDLNLREVNVLDKVNIEIDENTFDIEPPEGYTQVTLSDILQMIPAEAKAGLAGLGIIPAGFVVWKRRRKRISIHPG
jgi:hypothetical protein